MKRILAFVLILLMVIVMTACDATNPAIVDDSPPINVNIAGNTVEDSRLGTMSKDYFVGVAEGDITGHTSWTKMGYLAASSGSMQTVWEVGGQYVFPVAAQGMEVRSSSVEDDPLKADGITAGTGVYSVKIWYLTNTFIEKTETITLNGTANVNTVNTDIYRVNYFQMVTAGTGNAAAGLIDIRNKTDHTTVYSRISTGYTRARSSVYTVPDGGKCLYITDITLSCAYSSAGKAVRFVGQSTWSDLNNTIVTFFVPFMEVMLVDNVYSKVFTIPHKMIAGTDLKFTVIGETNAQCTVVLRGWLENN